MAECKFEPVFLFLVQHTNHCTTLHCSSVLSCLCGLMGNDIHFVLLIEVALTHALLSGCIVSPLPPMGCVFQKHILRSQNELWGLFWGNWSHWTKKSRSEFILSSQISPFEYIFVTLRNNPSPDHLAPNRKDNFTRSDSRPMAKQLCRMICKPGILLWDRRERIIEHAFLPCKISWNVLGKMCSSSSMIISLNLGLVGVITLKSRIQTSDARGWMWKQIDRWYVPCSSLAVGAV